MLAWIFSFLRFSCVSITLSCGLVQIRLLNFSRVLFHRVSAWISSMEKAKAIEIPKSDMYQEKIDDC